MPLPREVVPGRIYLITRRCTQRQFLLRPDAATNDAFVIPTQQLYARGGR